MFANPTHVMFNVAVMGYSIFLYCLIIGMYRLPRGQHYEQKLDNGSNYELVKKIFGFFRVPESELRVSYSMFVVELLEFWK
jgi:hypothetical protein